MVNVKDYYSYIKEQFPEVSMADIKRILNYGFKQVYLLNSFGGDLCIKDNDFWCYMGTLTNNSLRHFHYYVNKLTVRLRVLYKRKNIQWDGYYYFALTDKQYEDYVSQQNTKGRKRKKFKYGNQYLFKMLDECKLREYNRKYIFRVPVGYDLGFVLYKPDYVTTDAELIITRDSQKFEDILVNNNKYDLL